MNNRAQKEEFIHLILSKKNVKILQEWIEKYSRMIPYPKSNDTFYVKKNGKYWLKNNLLQIFVNELHKYVILTISYGRFSGTYIK